MSENPLIETADVTEDGPGIGKISIFLSIHSLIKIVPGSEMHGVPASEIKDTINPLSNSSKTFGKFFFFIKFMVSN